MSNPHSTPRAQHIVQKQRLFGACHRFSHEHDKKIHQLYDVIWGIGKKKAMRKQFPFTDPDVKTIPNRRTSPILFFRIHPSKLLTEGLRSVRFRFGNASDAKHGVLKQKRHACVSSVVRGWLPSGHWTWLYYGTFLDDLASTNQTWWFQIRLCRRRWLRISRGFVHQSLPSLPNAGSEACDKNWTSNESFSLFFFFVSDFLPAGRSRQQF